MSHVLLVIGWGLLQVSCLSHTLTGCGHSIHTSVSEPCPGMLLPHRCSPHRHEQPDPLFAFWTWRPLIFRGKVEGRAREKCLGPLDLCGVLEGCVSGPIPSVLIPFGDRCGPLCACSPMHQATGMERSPCPVVAQLPGCVLSSAQAVDEPFPILRYLVSCAE